MTKTIWKISGKIEPRRGKTGNPCFLGGAHIDEPDDALIAAIREELRDLMGVTATPAFHTVQRWRKAMAQYTLGHQGRVREIRGLAGRHEGLALAGNFLDGIGIPDCIRSGQAAVRQLEQAG